LIQTFPEELSRKQDMRDNSDTKSDDNTYASMPALLPTNPHEKEDSDDTLLPSLFIEKQKTVIAGKSWKNSIESLCKVEVSVVNMSNVRMKGLL
jgi:hypothetical protein